MIVPVILSGGSGTRLWPLSRSDFPKQFLSLVSSNSLLQDTALRARSVTDNSPPVIVCSEAHRFVVAEQLTEAGIRWQAILLEPVARNTAPAVAAAALHASSQSDDPLLLVMPSDHVITDIEAFQKAVTSAARLAEAGHLVTFGIKPAHPEVGYGYIRRGAELTGSDCFVVEEFVEKPDLPTARHYLESGDHFWNSGMFLFRCSRYLEELQTFGAEIARASREAVDRAVIDQDFVRLDASAFGSSPVDSIDYAVMEQTRKAAVVSLDAGWSDLGSWSSLWDVQEHDDDGNLQSGDVLTMGAKNSLIRAESRVVAAVGVENLLVVETADAVLVAGRNHDQGVKQIVGALRESGFSQADSHRRVRRSWGSRDLLDAGEHFNVKRISVKPGACLSSQMHSDCSGHWTVVGGRARVSVDGEVQLLSANQSAYIPPGSRHSLENCEHVTLEVIAIQWGSCPRNGGLGGSADIS